MEKHRYVQKKLTHLHLYCSKMVVLKTRTGSTRDGHFVRLFVRVRDGEVVLRIFFVSSSDRRILVEDVDVLCPFGCVTSSKVSLHNVSNLLGAQLIESCLALWAEVSLLSTSKTKALLLPSPFLSRSGTDVRFGLPFARRRVTTSGGGFMVHAVDVHGVGIFGLAPGRRVEVEISTVSLHRVEGFHFLHLT